MIVRVRGAFELQQGIYYEYDNESQPIGQGGMGIVYAGNGIIECNPAELYPVALKLITNPTQDLILRAQREASVQIDHPNLLRMYGFVSNMEVDAATGTYQPRFYVVMELLSGVTLKDIIEGKTSDNFGQSVPAAEELYSLYVSDRLSFVRTVFQNVLDGAAELHSHGIVHRDLDPSNIMVTSTGGLKIIDYGICKALDGGSTQQDGGNLTQVGALIGKVDYAAPEICSGDVAHHNVTTDIYALGIMLYQLYVGELPFKGDNNSILKAQMTAPVPVGNIHDKTIRRIVSKATQKRQADRYQSVEEMRGDFKFSDDTIVDSPFDRDKKEGIHPSERTSGFSWVYAVLAIAGLCAGVLVNLFFF